VDRYFHAELNTLRTHLTQMGSLAVEAVETALRSLLENDLELAERVIQNDPKIDELEVAIDFEATRYLTLRAPVASDLRILTVAIKASHDFERVGDEAKKVAKKTRRILNRKGSHNEFYNFEKMGNQVADMIRRALECFVEEDVEGAKQILRDDEEIDAFDKANLRALVAATKDSPEDTETFLDLVFISKALERIADHATNLAEEIIYYKTAKDARLRDA
jgi:phosphate transport system protein